MTEDFIHFIWKFRLFNQMELKTAEGESITIISPGIHNKDAGPDFENVKIKIGDTLWAGSAEIHINSSDWEKHRHSTDKAYDNVVLHVVYEYDKPVLRSDGTEPPTLEIKQYIKPGVEKRYKELMENLTWIPCEKQICRVDDIYVQNWLQRVLVERLEEKSKDVLKLADEYKGSWDDTFYILLARNFGFKVNALPFELLARSLPRQILSKHKDSALQTEALLFGQSGLLEDVSDDYTGLLAAEYGFLQKKYQLKPLEPYLWKFLRMRPQNFPTLRLAQFAALILKSSHLFSKVLEMKEEKKISELFRDLPVSPYWESHYRPGKTATRVSSQLGQESINNILLNTVALTLFSYGKYIDDDALVQRSVSILESLPFEMNNITRRFKDIGIRQGSAGNSQALLQLKKTWCDRKNCLLCAVGAKIINSD